MPAQRLSADTVHDTEIDWSQVAELRTQASEMLTGALQDRQHLDQQAQRELGRSIIVELLQTTAANNLAVGRRAWSMDEQDRIGQAVFLSLIHISEPTRQVR